MIDWVPPSATGQPTAWAAAASIRPTEPDRGVSSRPKTWAATPENSARAGSSRKRAVVQVAGSSAFVPNRPSVTGWRGTCVSGWNTSSTRSSKWRTIGSKTRCQRAASGPSDAVADAASERVA